MSSYNVGKRKPPRQHRFKKGSSGNPKGRPKGSRNIATEIKRELKRSVTVKEGGVTKSIPKGMAIAKSVVAKSIQGDPRASAMVMAVSDRESNYPWSCRSRRTSWRFCAVIFHVSRKW